MDATDKAKSKMHPYLIWSLVRHPNERPSCKKIDRSARILWRAPGSFWRPCAARAPGSLGKHALLADRGIVPPGSRGRPPGRYRFADGAALHFLEFFPRGHH